MVYSEPNGTLVTNINLSILDAVIDTVVEVVAAAHLSNVHPAGESVLLQHVS